MAALAQHIASLYDANIMLSMTLASIFVGSVAAGLAGFAFSAIAGAILFHWLEPIQAVPLLLACSITTQLLSITRLWHAMQWRQCFPYLVGGVAGIPVGANLLAGINPHAFAAGFGIFLTCYSIYMLSRPGFLVGEGGRLAAVAAGFAGGITGGATAFPGAFPTIWCSLQRLSKIEQRGDCSAFYSTHADRDACLFFQARHVRASDMDDFFLVHSGGRGWHLARSSAFRSNRRSKISQTCAPVFAGLRGNPGAVMITSIRQ